MFEEAQGLFNSMLMNSDIQYRMQRLKNKDPIRDKNKYFEMTHYNHLGRGLSLEDNDLIQLSLSDCFLDIACEYLGEEPKVRNILGWLMGECSFPRNFSQTWHRDTEGEKVLKVWMYFSDVDKTTGAADYVVKSCKGKRNDYIWYNLVNEKREWPGESGYLSPQAASQIPAEDIVTASGKRGTLIFADTNGFHRGGYVLEGFRASTHTVYLRSDAREIVEGPITHFNYNPKVNYCDFDSSKFINLSERQKACLL